jgi:hypothetical protein
MLEPLEDRIIAWRKQVSAALPPSEDAVSELEDHLRTEIARRLSVGECADEAFVGAVRRVGDTKSLADEFARVGWRRAPRAVLVVNALLVLLVLATIASQIARFHAGFPRYVESNIVIVSGLEGILGLGGIGLAVMIEAACHRLPVWKRRAFGRALWNLNWVSLALVLIGFAISSVWAVCSGEAILSGLSSGAVILTLALATVIVAQVRSVSDHFRLALLCIAAVTIGGLGMKMAFVLPVPYGWLCLSVTCAHLALVVLRRQEQIALVSS